MIRLVLNAHVIPTDQMQPPETIPVEPIQDLFGLAMNSRPELKQDQIWNQQHPGEYAGHQERAAAAAGCLCEFAESRASGDCEYVWRLREQRELSIRSFLGGYGSVLSQLFSRNFPDYTVGVQLNHSSSQSPSAGGLYPR